MPCGSCFLYMCFRLCAVPKLFIRYIGLMISTWWTWQSKPNRCFFGRDLRYKLQRHSLILKRGRGTAAHLHLKRHARKSVSASTQNVHNFQILYFQNDIIIYLWGILSWNFTDTFWGHLRLILHLVQRGIINALYVTTSKWSEFLFGNYS